jgi:hypothetical protein
MASNLDHGPGAIMEAGEDYGVLDTIGAYLGSFADRPVATMKHFVTNEEGEGSMLGQGLHGAEFAALGAFASGGGIGGAINAGIAGGVGGMIGEALGLNDTTTSLLAGAGGVFLGGEGLGGIKSTFMDPAGEDTSPVTSFLLGGAAALATGLLTDGNMGIAEMGTKFVAGGVMGVAADKLGGNYTSAIVAGGLGGLAVDYFGDFHPTSGEKAAEIGNDAKNAIGEKEMSFLGSDTLGKLKDMGMDLFQSDNDNGPSAPKVRPAALTA